MIEWKEQRFSDINTKEFYEIFKFRCEVFVVEQEILYNDFDYKDYKAIHLSAVSYTHLTLPTKRIV